MTGAGMNGKPDQRPIFCQAEISQDVLDVAVRWLVWLRSGTADEIDSEAFLHWCARSPEHEQAALEVIHFWALLDMAADPDYDWISFTD